MPETGTLAAPNPAPQLSIIIISFNTREETLACLASVVAETRRVRYEIIVVDNASEDGSAEAIAAEHPGVRLLALTENVGFARGNNIGAKEARGTHILLLNPDTVVLDGALDKLWAFALSTPSAGIWGSRTHYPDGRLDPTCCFRRMTLWSQFCLSVGLAHAFPRIPFLNPEAYARWERDSVRAVDVICGCYLLITRVLWSRLNGFDPVFFMYGEEQDLCLRARQFGASPLFVPDAPIIHIGGASERTRAGKMIKLLAARATLMQRYFRPGFVPLGVAILALWPLTRMAAHGLRARLTGSDRHAEEATAWSQVWRERRNWLSGFQADIDDFTGTPLLTPRVGQPSTNP